MCKINKFVGDVFQISKKSLDFIKVCSMEYYVFELRFYRFIECIVGYISTLFQIFLILRNIILNFWKKKSGLHVDRTTKPHTRTKGDLSLSFGTCWSTPINFSRLIPTTNSSLTI
jgi:hypothetical protein